MIGGYLLSLICLSIITKFMPYPVINLQFVLITILLSSISQVGDIIVSYFKRASAIWCKYLTFDLRILFAFL